MNDLDKKIEQASQALQKLTETPSAAEQPWGRSLVLWLVSLLLIFSLMVFLLMFFLIKQNHGSPEAILRLFGTPLIIVVAVLLVIIGFGESQIAPVMGLLGTVAGYLMGRTPQPPAANAPNQPPPAGR